MPATVQWGNDAHTAIYYHLTEPWVWDDFYTIVAEGREMRLRESIPVVDIVIDTTEIRHIPQGALSQISMMGRRESITGPHVRRIVVVGATPFLWSILTMVSRVAPRFGNRVRMVKSMEDVERALALDDALPEPN